MASIAIMIGGAVLNAAAFTGGNYLAKYIAGDGGQAALAEKFMGGEFMGGVTKEMEKHKTYIRRGRTEIHRDQAIVERFNRTLAERLFGHQYAVEMLLPEGKRSTEWVKRLPEVVHALNNEVTSLIGKKPSVAVKEKAASSLPKKI